MGRTPQTSIRFDPQKLELIKLKENLPTVQKVVDYLVDAYWWQCKLNPGLKNGQPATEYQSLEAQIKDADETQILELLKWNIIKSKTINQLDKRILMQAISEKLSKLK